MGTKYSSFSKYSFIGEFFKSEEDYDVKFSGKIDYCIETGLILHFNIADSDFPMEVDSLYGILDNGQKCTLIGPFDFNRAGFRAAKVLTRYGKHRINYLIIGDYLDNNKKYLNSRFTFSNMQEFFCPKGWIGKIKYTDSVLETIDGDGWVLDVENRATFDDVTFSFENLIFSENENKIKSLVNSAKEIFNEIDNSNLLMRKSLEFLFNYKPKESSKIEAIYSDIYKLTSLFSIFMNIPVFPDEIELVSECGITVQVIANQNLEGRTVKLALSEPSFHFMPINRDVIKLSSALSKWFKIYDDYRVLSTTFQYETNYRTLHSAYSDIILFLTNVESIAIDLGTHKIGKYLSPIEKYGSSELIESLKSIFIKVNSNDLASNLSDLRNELAHVGRPKKLIHQLDINDYVDVAKILKLIVVSHMLSKIDFSLESIYKYQKKLLPKNYNS